MKLGTVTCQRLADDAFDVYEWITDTLSSLLVNFMAVNIGCAYLCRNKEGTIFYVYAASAVAPFKTKVNSPEELEKFADQFKSMTHHDLLHTCFNNDQNPFGSSDIMPYKLVCTYIWITK